MLRFLADRWTGRCGLVVGGVHATLAVGAVGGISAHVTAVRKSQWLALVATTESCLRAIPMEKHIPRDPYD
jgi:hypothetical protein